MKVDHLAIVGLGNIGRKHLNVLKDIHPEIDVTLVRTGIGKQCKEEKLANQTVSSINNAIQEKIQAAIITTPANIHLEQSKQLVQAGIHILVEKPLSHSVNGIDKLIDDVNKKGIVGMVGYVLRHHPGAKRFKQLLNSEIVGKLLHARVECSSYLPHWHPKQDYRKSVSARSECGGVLLELSHELDYIRWFFGKIKFVKGILNNSKSLEINVEDCADLILMSDNGLPISVHLDFNSRYPVRQSVVYGTKGKLIWDVLKKKVIWFPTDGDPQVELFNVDGDFIYREQLSHFLQCVEKGKTPIVTIKNGEQALRLVEAAKKSHETGKRVDLA